MRTIKDLRFENAAAVRATVSVVALATPSDLDLPTPCAGWDLRTLLAHMTAQHRGFAAAAAGRGAEEAVWRPDPHDQNLLPGYALSAARVAEEFAADDRLDRPVTLPELGEQPFPLRLAVAFHLVDYVVHGWDVARTLGAAWELPDEVLDATLPIARAVPADDSRTQPGAAFGPALATPATTSAMDQILSILGRSPTWRPESVGGRC